MAQKGNCPLSSLRILVTGAGSGIGRGLCQSLSGKQHRVFCADNSREALQETVQLLGEQAPASAHLLDVTSSTDIARFMDSLNGERIDILINNAGLQHLSAVEVFPEEKWNQLIGVMLTGTFLLTRALLPGMRTQGFGRIINIGSIHSLVASPFKSAYVAAKHGLIGFSKTIALETAGTDITINTICPAYVRTPLVDAQIRAQAQAHGINEQEVIDRIMLEPMPKKAFITVEEIAGTVDYLISAAARNMTGQTLVLDGGWTAR
jgi:3-hydroxybutyrate dehydrogenase